MLTGNKDLNNLIENYSEKINLIYGEAGAGKTTLCLLALIEQLKENKKVLFIDSGENFSLERFNQLSNKIKLENLIILKIQSFNDQHKKILALEKIKNIDLIIIDSITKHFRRLHSKEPELAKAMLNKQLRILSKINIPKIITSEVYSDLKTIQPVSKNLIRSFAEKIIKLNKEPRILIQEHPKKISSKFKMINEGILILG